VDADPTVIDCDGIDKRAQIGLAKWNAAGGDTLAHQRAEAFDFGPVDTPRRAERSLASCVVPTSPGNSVESEGSLRS